MGLGLAAAAVLPASRAMAGLAVDPSSSVNAYAGTIELGGTNASDNPSGIPYNNTTTATDPAGTSSVLLNLSDASLVTNFTASIFNPFGGSATGNVQLVFTPSADLAYNLSGSHAETGPASYHMFSADLTDLSTKTQLFDNQQESYSANGETFTLGGQDGTEDNTLIGSLTGTLLANHQYGLTLASETDAMPMLFNELPFLPGLMSPFTITPMGTSASGSVTLGLSATTSAVPLPPAGWMGLAMIAAVGALLKLRRNALA
jgi:hypothetical protein